MVCTCRAQDIWTIVHAVFESSPFKKLPASFTQILHCKIFESYQAFRGVEEFSVPDGVRELCDGCFEGCSSVRRVTFGPSSLLERIGALCYYGCGLVEFKIPVSVRAIGRGAFGECELTRGIMCRNGCCFRDGTGSTPPPGSRM